MDDRITIRELADRNDVFLAERDWHQFQNAKDLAIGIAGETGELLDHVKWKNEEEFAAWLKQAENRKKVEEEVADIFIFLIEFCKHNKIDLAQAMLDKIKLNGKRYPVEKAKGNKKKYTEL